ncbi:hypothetical protein [Acuticoccus sp. I52.16.1]|uniref:hypothetical protein n=1 Tax=Acuticoccus sp. I52.16.1 TaxID=2928472 RepID=UPI001FD41CFE|nr:hypothetical protein [Acuticoccus sp. I52.16.1]UOM33518.1 hypothetical protein MRB58_16915 [Acuticoccus sp. I52.16.1]
MAKGQMRTGKEAKKASSADVKAAKKRAGPKYLQDPLFQTPGVPKVVSTGKKP